MKKKLLLLLTVTLTDLPTFADQGASLEQRVGDLEKRLQAVESIPAIVLVLNLKNSTKAAPQPTPATQADAPLELLQWSYEFKRGEY